MKKLVFPIIVLMLLPDTAFAWGKEGHAIVADIAEAQLTPRALDAVRQLLSSEGYEHLNQISSWADEVKKEIRDADGGYSLGQVSHSIRLPLDSSGYVANLCPTQFCAVAAIERYDTILADKSAPVAQREEALKYVAHLVGDVHQPLHASAVTGSGIEVTFDGKPTTLHKVWDTGIIKDEGGTDAETIAHDLMQNQRGLNFGGDPASWALEGRDIARDRIFAQVPQHPTATLQLPSNYADENWPIVEARLTQAGMRLGAMLNAALN